MTDFACRLDRFLAVPCAAMLAACTMHTTIATERDGGSSPPRDGSVAFDSGAPVGTDALVPPPVDTGTPPDSSAALCRCDETCMVAADDRRCTGAADCAVYEHQKDCCGGIQAIGVRASELTRYQGNEVGCIPACACAADYTLEDGTRVNWGRAAADCVGGSCVTVEGLGEGDLCGDGLGLCSVDLVCCLPGGPGGPARCSTTCPTDVP